MSIDLKGVNESYKPDVYSMPNNKKDILGTKSDLTMSTKIEYPKFSFGFQHFIHQSKDKMEITEQFKGRKRVYLVLSQFERYVDDYDNTIDNASLDYFGLDGKKEKILSRAFFKLWEILFMFDLIPLNGAGFVSAHLAEAPGSFIQATSLFREVYAKKGANKNDKYYGISLHGDQKGGGYVPVMHGGLKDFNKNITVHKTYPKKESEKSPNKDDGNLEDPKTVRRFSANFKTKKAEFITGDGGFNWKNENLQEQEAFKLIFGEILTAVKIQAKGGSFVLKIFESFTDSTLKLLCILGSFYKDIYIVKPLMSRVSNSEKYAVCMGFLYGDKDKAKDNKIDVLDKLQERLFKERNRNVMSIFSEYQPDENYLSALIKMNTDLANKQFIAINNIVDFINKENYRGEVYETSRQSQIEASKFWINIFLPDSLQKVRKMKQDEVNRLATLNSKRAQELGKQIK